MKIHKSLTLEERKAMAKEMVIAAKSEQPGLSIDQDTWKHLIMDSAAYLLMERPEYDALHNILKLAAITARDHNALIQLDQAVYAAVMDIERLAETGDGWEPKLAKSHPLHNLTSYGNN